MVMKKKVMKWKTAEHQPSETSSSSSSSSYSSFLSFQLIIHSINSFFQISIWILLRPARFPSIFSFSLSFVSSDSLFVPINFLKPPFEFSFLFIFPRVPDDFLVLFHPLHHFLPLLHRFHQSEKIHFFHFC